jgi:hypothetical protein
MTSLLGKTVDVYWNTRRKCFSVRLNGRIVAWWKEVTLEDCRFIVREAGRQRVRLTKRKNVHAWVRGVVTARMPDYYTASGQYVRYNPYKNTTFVDDDGRAARRGAYAYLYTDNARPEIRLESRYD